MLGEPAAGMGTAVIVQIVVAEEERHSGGGGHDHRHAGAIGAAHRERGSRRDRLRRRRYGHTEGSYVIGVALQQLRLQAGAELGRCGKGQQRLPQGNGDLQQWIARLALLLRTGFVE